MSAKGVDLRSIQQAEARIRPHIDVTPARRIGEGRVWLKCENRQRTGSFKIRGALNKVLGLSTNELGRGIVAASAGNHGQGVALAASLRRAQATIVVPKGAGQVKGDRIRELGAEVVFASGDYAAAEAEGLALARRRGATWVSPYNDPEVIAGQGTIALELAGQLDLAGPSEWEVFVPVSGGGLLGGIAIGLKALAPQVRVVGVQPEAAPYMHTFFNLGDLGNVVEMPTIADGLSGAVEAGAVPLPPVRGSGGGEVVVRGGRGGRGVWPRLGRGDLGGIPRGRSPGGGGDRAVSGDGAGRLPAGRREERDCRFERREYRY